jgi:hypothetical protein
LPFRNLECGFTELGTVATSALERRIRGVFRLGEAGIPLGTFETGFSAGTAGALKAGELGRRGLVDCGVLRRRPHAVLGSDSRHAQTYAQGQLSQQPQTEHTTPPPAMGSRLLRGVEPVLTISIIGIRARCAAFVAVCHRKKKSSRLEE